LSGTVGGPNAAGAIVTFSGAVTGSTIADDSGRFTYVTGAASVGVVQAIALDQLQHPSAPALASIAVSAPTITLAVSGIDADGVTLSGHITDVDAAGETVVIAGAEQTSVTADSQGNFSFVLAPANLGTIDAVTTDDWGQVSGVAEVAASSMPPILTSFTAIQTAGNSWLFEGTVVAANYAGLTVNFGGLPSLVGQSVSVAADGTFFLVAQLQAGERGSATAQAIDAQTQASNMLTFDVVN
jgi:hypothetical protein